MDLDPRTVVILASLSALLTAATTLIVIRCLPEQTGELWPWVAACGSQCVAWLLMASRDRPSVVAGVFFVSAAGLSLWTARRFWSELRRALLLVPLVAAAFAVLAGLVSPPRQTVAIVVISCATVAATFGLLLLQFGRLHADLQRLATIDPLTKCLNRAELEQRIGAELARSHRHGLPLSLLMIDIDRFKPINDAHGHAVGDLVLRAVADQLRNGLRVSDTVGRYGGDEFVALLPNVAVAQAVVAAGRLRRAVEAAGASTIPLTISIGVAGPLPGGDAASLIRRADAALYEAKSRGRNHVVAAET